MATLLNTGKLVLYDRWPGYPNPNLSCPTLGWDSTTYNCVTTPTWPIGTKIQGYQDNTDHPGYYVMIYLGFCEGTKQSASGNPIGDLSDGYRACFHADLSMTADGSAALWYMTTVDLTESDGTKGGPIAFACATLESDISKNDAAYGWFWCGGVCPDNTTIQDCTKLLADIKTDDSIAKGKQVAVLGDGTGSACLTIYDASGAYCPTSDSELMAAIGWAVDDD